MSALRSDLQVAPQEIFQTSTTQQTDLGARATTGDGRIFRYALASGAALVQGNLQQATAQSSSNFQGLGVSVAAGTGTFVVSTGSSVTLTVNQLAGGVLTVRSSTGSGFTYGIKSNPAITSGTVAFTLSDPLQQALATTSIVDVTPNPYSNVFVAPTALTGIPVGVAATNIPAASYGWLQTRGLCASVSHGAIPVASSIVASATTAGGFDQAATFGTQTVLGYAAITTTDAKYAPFFLTIE